MWGKYARKSGPWRSANPITQLAIDPITPRTLCAGTVGGGVFKSTDGAGTWSALNTGLSILNVRALAVDPIEPRRVYAGTYGGGVFTIEQVPPPCTGDCDGNDRVAITELIVGVNIALGHQPLANCPEFDRTTNDGVEINELVTAMHNALNGCGGG